MKKTTLKKHLSASVFACVLWLNALAQCPILPTPVVYKEVDGVFSFGDQLSINESNFPEEIKPYFAETLRDKFQLRTVFSKGDLAQVKFKRMYNTPTDFYSINVAENITVNYSSEASCFYAINSLMQLIQGDTSGYYVQKAFVQDYPKFQWRGLHLDVSRHFFTVDEVKRYIDLMALYKFNVFHWHLTDDQGWRIEIKKYPKLTEVGAWRDSTVENHFTMSPRTYSTERYGGFYTQEQAKDIVAYARSKYITVVPEIEMPGHSVAALAAYPQFSCSEQQEATVGLWGVFEHIFCAKEESIVFLQDILEEILLIFPSPYIHIGGDEAPKERWKKCKRCQAVIRENGLKDEHELQSYFIRKMDEYLTLKGRKLVGWDEILEGGLSDNATVMSWRGMQGGIDAAKQNHYVVMSPGSHCYFDHYQSTNPNEPLAIGGYTSLEKVYSFNPIPADLPSDKAFYILGGQANLWTEYIPTMKHLEYMAYPRAIALAQALWCQEKPSYTFFKEVFTKYHTTYLNRYQVNFSRAVFYPTISISQTPTGLKLLAKDDDVNTSFTLETKSDKQSNSEKRTVQDADSIFFNRGAEVEHVTVELTSSLLASPTQQAITVHPAIGLNVEFLTPPSPYYNTNKQLALVDGIFGKLPWKGNEWLGFDTSRIEFIVDLGKKSKIQSVALHFLDDKNAWIHLPEYVEVQVSSNKEKWTSLKGEATPLTTVQFEREVMKKGRYVKFIIKSREKIPEGNAGAGNPPWTFMDELIIIFK